MAAIKIGTRFSSVEEGKQAVLAYMVEQGLSYKVSKAARVWWVAVCKIKDCLFRICIARDNGRARITKWEEHNCSYSTHDDFRKAHLVAYFASQHQAAVVNN